MISVSSSLQPMGSPDPYTTFSNLLSETKRIFEIIRLRRTMLQRHTAETALTTLKEEHAKLAEQEDGLIRRYAELEHGTWGNLRSFFIRFRFRLAELEQNFSDRAGLADFMAGLDELIQELLQRSPVDMSRFLTYVFGYYRQPVLGRLRLVAGGQGPPSVPLSPLVSPMLQNRRASMYRVLSCNDLLHRTWTRQGRLNYEPMGIDPNLRQIYFFSRTQQENAALMYEDMMERNRAVQDNIDTYKKQFKKWDRIRKYHSQKNNRLQSLENKRKESKAPSPNARLKNVETAKPRLDTDRKFGLPMFGRTMFRIRPSGAADRSFKEQELSFNETRLNLSRTPLREYRRPATIKIQFRNVPKSYI